MYNPCNLFNNQTNCSVQLFKIILDSFFVTGNNVCGSHHIENVSIFVQIKKLLQCWHFGSSLHTWSMASSLCSSLCNLQLWTCRHVITSLSIIKYFSLSLLHVSITLDSYCIFICYRCTPVNSCRTTTQMAFYSYSIWRQNDGKFWCKTEHLIYNTLWIWHLCVGNWYNSGMNCIIIIWAIQKNSNGQLDCFIHT